MNAKIRAVRAGPACLALAVAAASLAAPARAAEEFDGRWAVEVVVDRGECPQGTRLPIRVRDGRASYGGLAPVKASGAIRNDGGVAFQVIHSDNRIAARGKLAGDSGSGRWTLAAKGCAGRWFARRQG